MLWATTARALDHDLIVTVPATCYLMKYPVTSNTRSVLLPPELM
jgi:hypothetical protein